MPTALSPFSGCWYNGSGVTLYFRNSIEADDIGSAIGAVYINNQTPIVLTTFTSPTRIITDTVFGQYTFKRVGNTVTAIGPSGSITRTIYAPCP